MAAKTTIKDTLMNEINPVDTLIGMTENQLELFKDQIADDADRMAEIDNHIASVNDQLRKYIDEKNDILNRINPIKKDIDKLTFVLANLKGESVSPSQSSGGTGSRPRGKHDDSWIAQLPTDKAWSVDDAMKLSGMDRKGTSQRIADFIRRDLVKREAWGTYTRTV